MSHQRVDPQHHCRPGAGTGATVLLLLVQLVLPPLLGACGDDQPPGQAFVVQLFKSRGVAAGAITITARQGDTTRELTPQLAFDNCSDNRVRIIPRQVDGSAPPVELTVSAAAGGLASVTRTVQLPAPELVPITLGSGPWEPQCAGATPDAGPPQPDGGEALPTGAPCSDKAQCAGGICLQSAPDGPFTVTFSGGYCTTNCTGETDCGAGICWHSKDGMGTPQGSYCMKPCVGAGDCRPSYTCTTSSKICFPQ